MEAASVAWHHLGWTPVGFSEIDPFPCAILKHRFPNTPNYGSLTEYASWPLGPGSIDLLVGGTPCQSFSVAGLRRGLADPRGNLALVFLGLADKLKPKWIIWENVPGVLSSNGGRDFGSFLGALVELGYGFAYRILDAQYVGGPRAVPQRRRRVFVVACLGGWEASAAALSLRQGLSGNPSPGRKKRKEASDVAHVGAYQGVYENRPTDGRITGPHPVCPTMTSRFGTGGGNVPLVHHVGESRGIPNCEVSGTLRANPGSGWRSDGTPVEPVVVDCGEIRRLTARECERLQGFPDDWSMIPWKGKPASECPDAPRLKACGNSMAVPVMRFIGENIHNLTQK